jgi:hypothetical protein
MTMKLPTEARNKFAAIAQAADEAATIARRSVERVNDLRKALGNNPNHASAEEISDEIARLQLTLPLQQQRHRDLAALVTNLRGFIEGLGPHVALSTAKVPKLNLTDETVKQAIERTRDEIATVRSDLSLVQVAPPPKAELRKRVKAHVQDLAERGCPVVSVDANRTNLAFRWRSYQALTPGMSGDDVAATLAWLFPDDMTKRLLAEVDRMPEPAIALSADDKRNRVAELKAKIDALEREEEALVEKAHADGYVVARRPDALPAAVLGVVIARARAKAA